MKTIFSNVNNQYSEKELILKARENDIKEIELLVDHKRLLELESLNGDEELNLLKSELDKSEIKLYGFCLYTDFNMCSDIMLAKKCVNLLNKLEGKMLRLVMKPQKKITRKTIGDISAFLNSLARFSSYSAGGGEGETIVRIAYDILNQPGFGFDEILEINNALRTNRNVGVALNSDYKCDNKIIEKIIQVTNGHEFVVNHISVDENTNNNYITNFLSDTKNIYDGPVILELKKDGENTDGIIDLISKIKFDKNIIDYSKISYQSSVARFFRKFGAAAVEPASDIIAGVIGTWKYVFKVGCQGIKNNGGLKLAFHHSTNWEPFQFDDPESDGFVSVIGPDHAVLEKRFTKHDACTFIHITVTEGNLKPDDEITIIIGDTLYGSKGSRSQTFAQNGFSFFTLIDPQGYGSYFQHPNPPSINIKGGKTENIKVIAPSVVYVDERFEVGIRVEDCHHNVASDYFSEFKIKINGKECDNLHCERIKENDALLSIKNIALDETGVYVIEVIDKNNITGKSNSVKCTSNKNDYKIFWGDIHCHLGYMDSVGTTDKFYDYAKNISFLDFVSHSEHMDSFSCERQASNQTQWDIIRKETARHNQPGKFVTLLGYENSEIWDANIYFPDDNVSWHVDSFAERLFDFARKNNAIVVPHMTTYPQRQRGYDWANYEEDVIPVAEIYSSHGSSEFFGGERPLVNCEPGGYIVEALNRGLKLGFIGSSDGHDCMPGNSVWGKYMNGLVAVYCKELTREAIFDAIKNRRCYATTNARILGFFDINGNISGSEIDYNDNKPLMIKVEFYGTGDIEIMQIIKNGKIISSTQGTGRNLEFELEDIPDKKGHNYYYVRMKQIDGEMAWLSPIFVNLTSE